MLKNSKNMPTKDLKKKKAAEGPTVSLSNSHFPMSPRAQYLNVFVSTATTHVFLNNM